MAWNWSHIPIGGFRGGEGLATGVFRADSWPEGQWIIVGYPEGTDPSAVVRHMKTLQGHLWDVTMWTRPYVLLIRCAPLTLEDLYVDGVKPWHLREVVNSTNQDLHHLLVAGFWSALGPERVANMRLEGMEQAERKGNEEAIWGEFGWVSFVCPDGGLF